MKTSFRPLLCGLSLMLGLSLPLVAQEPEVSPADQAAAEAFQDFINSLEWKTSGKGSLGARAEIEVPAGYRFTGGPGTIKLMEAYGNLTNGQELGYISPDDMGWFAVFEFDDCGYVKDDEKDKLDPEAILKQLQEGQKAANAELAKRGRSTFEVVGWHTPPFYNTTTKNLEWAIRLRSSDGGETINYRTKLLGRRGVMDVVLVCNEAAMPTIVPEYQRLLTGFAFKPEETYASFKQGDKIAEYGLTGLIVGGGLLVAAKSGLLAKLWKPALAIVVGIGVFIKRIFTGKTRESI